VCATFYRWLTEARNVLLFTLLIDDCHSANSNLWSVFFDLYIDESTIKVIRSQAECLLAISGSIHIWNESSYGKFLRMVNRETIQILRRYWSIYCNSINDSYITEYKAAVEKTYEKYFKSVQTIDPPAEAALRFWANGTMDQAPNLNSTSRHSYHNPLFAYSDIGGSRFSVHKNTSPLSGFHVFTLITTLSYESPISRDTQIRSTILDNAIIAAKEQWKSWCNAFSRRVAKHIKSDTQGLRVRFFISDPIALCLGLNQHHPFFDGIDWYTRPGSSQPVCLDDNNYHFDFGDGAPRTFIAIDTGYLVDSIGLLVLLPHVVSLRQSLLFVLYTNVLAPNTMKDSNLLSNMMCGDIGVMCCLFGVVPVPYLCGVTTRSYRQYNLHDRAGPVTRHIT
jgi:hypothetical protein